MGICMVHSAAGGAHRCAVRTCVLSGRATSSTHARAHTKNNDPLPSSSHGMDCCHPMHAGTAPAAPSRPSSLPCASVLTLTSRPADDAVG